MNRRRPMSLLPCLLIPLNSVPSTPTPQPSDLHPWPTFVSNRSCLMEAENSTRAQILVSMWLISNRQESEKVLHSIDYEFCWLSSLMMMGRFRVSLMLLFLLGGGRIFSSSCFLSSYVCLTYTYSSLFSLAFFSKISFSSLLSPCHQNCQPQLCRPSPPRLCRQYHNCGILKLNVQFCR